jgi:hypothetical protein
MSRLTALQEQVLQQFFHQRREFFLTGGAALGGYHLRHRTTHDLDLFTATDALDEGERTLQNITSDLGLHLETLRRSPDFRRFLLQAPHEAVIVDLVKDVAPPLRDKIAVGSIVIDSAEEILVNKLCALLSRTEVRDLFDVAKLEEAGFDPIAAVELARRKDGGMIASQLAWVLSRFPIPPDVDALYGMTRSDLEAFRDSLVQRLTAAAFPET